MNAVLAQPDQRSAEWYAARRGRITASRVGAILGVSKYRTRADVLRDMVREWHGAPAEFTGNEATRWGEAHEADALAAYERQAGVMVETCGLVVHPHYDWIAVSPDGLIGRDGLVECKAPFRARYTEPSSEYAAQMQLQLETTARDWCDFAVWTPDGFTVTRVMRDREWFASALPDLQGFIEYLGEECADPERAALHLADKERDDSAWRSAVALYLHAEAELEMAEARKEEARKHLLELAPNGARGCGLQLIKAERSGAIDYARAFKQMLPDVDIEPFRRAGTTVFSVRIDK